MAKLTREQFRENERKALNFGAMTQIAEQFFGVKVPPELLLPAYNSLTNSDLAADSDTFRNMWIGKLTAMGATAAAAAGAYGVTALSCSTSLGPKIFNGKTMKYEGGGVETIGKEISQTGQIAKGMAIGSAVGTAINIPYSILRDTMKGVLDLGDAKANTLIEQFINEGWTDEELYQKLNDLGYDKQVTDAYFNQGKNMKSIADSVPEDYINKYSVAGQRKSEIAKQYLSFQITGKKDAAESEIKAALEGPAARDASMTMGGGDIPGYPGEGYTKTESGYAKASAPYQGKTSDMVIPGLGQIKHDQGYEKGSDGKWYPTDVGGTTPPPGAVIAYSTQYEQRQKDPMTPLNLTPVTGPLTGTSETKIKTTKTKPAEAVAPPKTVEEDPFAMGIENVIGETPEQKKKRLLLIAARLGRR